MGKNDTLFVLYRCFTIVLQNTFAKRVYDTKKREELHAACKNVSYKHNVECSPLSCKSIIVVVKKTFFSNKTFVNKVFFGVIKFYPIAQKIHRLS